MTELEELFQDQLLQRAADVEHAMDEIVFREKSEEEADIAREEEETSAAVDETPTVHKYRSTNIREVGWKSQLRPERPPLFFFFLPPPPDPPPSRSNAASSFPRSAPSNRWETTPSRKATKTG